MKVSTQNSVFIIGGFLQYLLLTAAFHIAGVLEFWIPLSIWFLLVAMQYVIWRYSGKTPNEKSASSFKKAFFNKQNNFFVEVGFDGRIRNVNSQTLEQFGYKKEELLGESIWDFLHPNDARRAQVEFRRLVDNDQSSPLELRVFTRDQDLRWVQWNTAVDCQEQKFFTFGIDISSRKSRDESEKNELRMFNQIFEKAPISMILINEERLVEDINESALKTLGFDYSQVKGRSLGEIYRCESIKNGEICGETGKCKYCPVRTRINASFEKDTSSWRDEDIFEVVNEDGASEVKYLSISTSKISFRGRDNVLLCLENFTELETIRRQLQLRNNNLNFLRNIQQIIIRANEREDLIRSVFGTLSQHRDIVYSWISCFSDANELIDLFSFGESVVDEVLTGSITESSKAGMWDLLQLLDRDNDTIILDPKETSSPDHHGLFTVFPEAKIVALPLSSKGNNRSYFFAAIRPESIDSRFITIIETIAQDLGYKLQYLCNKEKLVRATIEAEASNRAKDEFLSVMSHELLTPINPIVGYATLLKKEGSDRVEDEYIDGIVDGSNRLSKTINNMLELINLQNQKIIQTEQEFDLYSVIKEVRESYTAQAPQIMISQISPVMNGELISDGDSFRANLDILKSVLDKMMDNAVKFTKEGIIEVGYAYSSEDHSLLIQILDSGIGIREDSVGRIFNRFSGADHSNTRLHEGVGIGLSICKHYMDLVGGEIGVKSGVEKGSVFWFKIPAVRTEKQATPIGEISGSSAQGATRKKTVLLVDDSPVNLKVLCRLMIKMDFETFEAKDGQVALEMCNKSAYDLILTDIHMPFMSGVQLAKMIRMGYGKNTETPIIGVTADVSRELKETSLETDFDGWQLKPLKYESLYSEIQRVTQNTLVS